MASCYTVFLGCPLQLYLSLMAVEDGESIKNLRIDDVRCRQCQKVMHFGEGSGHRAGVLSILPRVKRCL
jgi:hypothetical protein